MNQNDMDPTSVQRASQTAFETPEARAAKNEVKEVDFHGKLAVDESKAIKTKPMTTYFSSQASPAGTPATLTGGTQGSVVSGEIVSPKTIDAPKLAVGTSVIKQVKAQ